MPCLFVTGEPCASLRGDMFWDVGQPYLQPNIQPFLQPNSQPIKLIEVCKDYQAHDYQAQRCLSSSFHVSVFVFRMKLCQVWKSIETR